MPGNQGAPPGQDKKVQRRQDVLARAKGRGHIDHGDIAELRKDHTDDELVDVMATHYATPEGQQEMAKSGMGGRDPREVARLVVGGR